MLGAQEQEPTIDCPLCGGAFRADVNCHAGCPMSSHCSLIRCPSCGYEFPDPKRSKLASWVSRMFERKQHGEDK